MKVTWCGVYKLFSEYSYALILRNLRVGGSKPSWGKRSHAVAEGREADSTTGTNPNSPPPTHNTHFVSKSIYIYLCFIYLASP